jgi:predicted metal-dependent phosphotriesterase family hydrolase
MHTCVEKVISVHQESGLNILFTTGFQVQDYFVPSHKDNFNPHKIDAFLYKIDFCPVLPCIYNLLTPC